MTGVAAPNRILRIEGQRINEEAKMILSKQIAGLVGPTLIALTISESEFVQPHLYDAQIPPVVYLSGTLIFLAGLSIVRVHNRWVAGWPVLVTLIGWFAFLGGLGRMFAAGQYHHVAQHTTALLVAEIVLLAVGIFLTFKAYSREDDKTAARLNTPKRDERFN